MTRLEGWESRLAATLAVWRGQSFEWGRADCLQFAGAVACALTGENPAAEHAGRYRTPLGAARRLPKGPDGRVAAMLDAHLPRRQPGFARRGDLALVAGADGDVFGGAAVAVDLTGRALIGFGEDGMTKTPMTAARIFWSLG